jgi:glycosyltransferase involved in cell wall biosynthesis
MTRQCRIIPFQPDIRPVLEAADVLVLTSEEESFGLVLIEAGAYECPVVATRTQGPQEIVVDGETGYLVEPGNEEQLAEKLELLTSSAALRKKMGRAGANRVRELFSAEKNTAKIETVFRKALSIHSQPE